MNQTGLCRWCLGCDVTVRAHGIVAPWIIGKKADVGSLTELRECGSCGLLFFSRPFDAGELATMYSGYRGEEYFRARHRWEPWYSAKLNHAIGHDSQTVVNRRAHLENFLTGYVAETGAGLPTKIVDFGGDEGQFMPDLETIRDRRVFEVSDTKPVEGVEQISDWDEVAAFRPDLVMMCHVLEHTEDARHLVEQAFNALESGGILYVEIPLDRPPRPQSTLSRKAYRRYTTWLATARWRWIPVDFLSLLSRRYLGRTMPGMVVKQSEHIQFFDRTALDLVLAAVGFETVRFSEYEASSNIPRLQMKALGVLATKPRVTA